MLQVKEKVKTSVHDTWILELRKLGFYPDFINDEQHIGQEIALCLCTLSHLSGALVIYLNY